MKVVSLLRVLGQPRDSKRISMLQEAGFTVEVGAFQRDYHSGRMPNCPVQSLGKIAHGHYLRRIGKIFAALPTLRHLIRESDLVYASGTDMAFAAIIAGFGLGKPIVLEVGDIRKVQVSSGVSGYVTRVLDRFIVNSCKLLVVTASGFVDGYYRKWLNSKTPTFVLENKLEEKSMSLLEQSDQAPLVSDPSLEKPLRIGYFGLLRSDWSWRVLEALAMAHPDDVKIVVAGFPMSQMDLPARAAKISNMEFRGEYQSPKDLPALYKSVDLVWACYPDPDEHDPNWLWAQSVCRSNRFYESCFFQRPIITIVGSGDAVEVERNGLGLLIRDQGTDAMIAAITGVSKQDLATWRRNFSLLPRSVYMYVSEVDDLKRNLEDIVARARKSDAQ
ncbi:MAG: hypothetical protein D4R92_01920 [Actinobacteria bacterium]|nr:MAG: hypothetical protein D4R92_01920 [Actinomycetota bacterium]